MTLEQQPASGELLGMSDEDFANLNGPPEVTAAGEKDEEEDKAPETVVEEPVVETVETEDTVEAEVETTTGVETEAKPEVAPEGKSEAKAPEGVEAKPDQEKKPEGSATGSESGVAAEVSAEQAMAAYKQIMAPFKANGKMIQLKTPEEAIQLMQMGANYTRKLQDIQPHRKMLLMLQNNDLLDEGKLSYLIDLDKKNPEAIKKLIKDAGIDPMDIDTTAEPTYFEGNHRVTDEEANFRHTLDEIVSTQDGQETVRLINTNWDQASKEALWQSPEIMSVIHEQRANGVYDAITAEMDRQKTLGSIPPTTPFLEAYKIVGDHLFPAAPKTEEKPAPVVVATTTAAPKSPVANGDKASAAAPTRTTPRKAEKLVNVLAMSDEDFLKLDNLNGRL